MEGRWRSGLRDVRVSETARPKFGDAYLNTQASESNPRREGMFVQVVRRSGRLNPGVWWQITDGNGDFWLSNPAYLRPAQREPVGVPSKIALRASERVMMAVLEAGWDSACDGLAAVMWHRFEFRKGRGDHRTLHVLAGDREVQVGISPSGRSVRVFVDGEEVPKR